MHIKRHTKGTSNEISFDVLEAKKGADADQAEDANPLGKISMFTLGKKKPSSTPSRETKLPTGFSSTGSASSASRAPWQFPSEEIASRKTKRKRGKRLLATVVVAGVAVALVAAAIAIVQSVQRHQQFIGSLDAQLEVVDEVYNATYEFRTVVEDALNTPLADIDAASMRERYDKVSDLSRYDTKLRAAKTALENLQPNFSSRGDSEKANDALTSINAQLNMYEIGKRIVEETLVSAEDFALADNYMTLLLQADSDAREAASITYEMNDRTAKASLDKSQEAMNLFASARDDLQASTYAQNNADLLEPYIRYANLRIDAQQAAIETDQAYLARSSAAMIAANDRYNSLEFQAADLYSTIKDQTPADLVQSAFDDSESLAQQRAAWNAEVAKCKPLL